MKERVELNNNGRSIESHCKHFEKKKWESRYIVCKKQTDLESPVFMLFKQKKDRQKDKVKQTIVLQNYIGFEKSFTLKNKCQTLTIITKDYNIVLSFQLPETLLQWETWLKNVGGQCTTHYMQLLKFPNQKDNANFVNKEVRCHLHDNCLVLVHSIPAETLLYCEIAAANINIDEPNFLVTIRPHHISDEEFVLCCPSIKYFAKFKTICDEGSLNRLLKKQQEGVWMTNIKNKIRAQDSISHLSDTFSGIFNFMNIPSTSANPSELFSSRLNINWKMTPKKPRNNSIFEQPLADYMNTVSGVENTDPETNNKQRSTSLPEYVNIQIRQPSKETYHELIQRKASTMTSPNETQRFSTLAEKRFADNRNSTKGRSMMDFSSLTYEDTGNRHESWRKAKKFISAFSPKSQQDLNRNARNGSTSSTKKIKKSSSTSALHYDGNLNNPSTLVATSSMSELDELPPSLNVAVSNPNTMLIFREHKESEEVPNGLVRVREENTLKARGGVNIVLARRLQSGVNGSYSKYDGERITHQYTQNSAGNDVMSKLTRKVTTPEVKFDSGETFDPIETAISRERDKMRQSERRASSISFQKNHQVNVHLSNVFKEALKTQKAVRNSSHSETTSQLSSTESLSSDARSKISIKKRSNSPPHLIAPTILPRQPSQRTLLQKQSSSSTDSLNSQKTTRTNVSIRLPTRVTANNSSSNENSSEESSSGANNKASNIYHQQVEHQLLHKSLSRQSSRRMSEGQGSNLSSETAPARKGYFKKNSKLRRSHRTLNESQY